MNTFYKFLVGVAFVAAPFIPVGVALAATNPTTNAANPISTSDATLNATNGDTAADAESFWVSSTPGFDISTSNIPAGVYSTPVLGGVGAGATFSDPLSLVTTAGIITGGVLSNMPAITPGTTYYYVAWASVGGTWYQGAIQSVTIPKLDQTITFAAPPGVVYGATDFAVSPTSDSALPVSVVASGACSNVGLTIHIVKAGTCSITASQSGDATHNAAPDVTQTFTVAQLPITVTAATNAKVYDGTAGASALPTITSGALVPGDTATLTETYDTKHVGTGKTLTPLAAIADGNSGNNYAVTYVATTTGSISAATLTVGATGVNKVYDGGTVANVTFTDNHFGSDAVTETGTATFGDKNVGIGKAVSVTGIAISGGADAANYTLGNTTTSTTANITVKTLTVTPHVPSKVYDATTAATVTFTDDRVAGDHLGESGTAAFDTKTAGVAKLAFVSPVALFGTDAGNYTVSAPTSVTADITPAPLTASFTVSNKVYDGTVAAVITTQSVSGVIPGDTVTVSGGSASFNNKNVGTGKTVTGVGFVLGGADGGNYAITAINTTTANITKRTLTVTVSGVNKVYDGTTAATVTFGDNRVGGDAIAETGTATFDTKHVGTGKTVSVTGIVISGGADAGNYTLGNTTAATTANLTPLGVTVTAVTNTKVYDTNTTAAGVPTISPALASGDTAVKTESYDTPTAGVGHVLTPAIVITDGNGGGNYAVTLVNNTTGVITQAPVTVSFTAANKVYDGGISASILTRTVTGTIVPDLTVTATGGTATFANKNVGNSKTVTATGFTLSNPNYAVTVVTPTAANITPKSLTVTATGVNKVYDGTTTASVIFGDNRLEGDVLTATGTSTFADKNVGTGKAVQVKGIALSGTDAGNYTANATTSTTATITARSLTVSATASNKVYDGTTAATVAFSDNALAGDVVTETSTSTNFDTSAVGAGKLVIVLGIAATGADASNYSLATTTATTTADITAAPLSGGGGGGGGGGILSGPLSFGFGSGGVVLGTSTEATTSSAGQVLGTSTYQFLHNLRMGSRGIDVTELQKVLIAAGFLHVSAPTGYFGSATLAAVKLYQAAHHISPVSGFVGPLTRIALNAGV